MAGIEAFLKGWVSRLLPQVEQDNDPGIVRLGRYGDVWTIGAVRKQHGLGDEGSYFVANNSGTGVATAAAPTAFSDTAPLLTIYNTDTPANQSNKRLHVDWIRLTQTAVGTAGVDLRLRGILDYTVPSGGTALNPVNPNSDVSARASVAQVRLLGTGVAQTGASRVVIGTLQAIPTKTAPMTVLDEVFLNFGGVETAYPNYNQAASANVHKLAWPVPPVVVGPGQCFMLEFLITSQSAASSWTAELGWWER
jgi:hypothetical protein